MLVNKRTVGRLWKALRYVACTITNTEFLYGVTCFSTITERPEIILTVLFTRNSSILGNSEDS